MKGRKIKMQIYSTMFPVKKELTKDELIRIVIEWNQGSPHNKIENLNWDGESRNIKFGGADLSLQIEELRAHNIVAIRFHQLDENNIIWTTDIVVNFDEHIFSIKLDRETTADTKGFVPKFKAPYIVSKLLEEGYIDVDGDFEISDKPISINKDNYKLIEDVICRECNCAMPVIYLTKSWGKYPIRSAELAYRLRGVAHVLQEDDSEVAKILKDSCGGRNAYHGSIGIYYPNISTPHKIILTDRFQGREDKLINRIVMIVCRYVNQQARNKMYTWEGVQNELLRLKYESVSEKRDIAESEKNAVYDNFDGELKEKDKTIEELNNRIIALTAENQGLHSKLDAVNDVPLLFYGVEEELYEGEIKEFILEILNEKLSHLPPNSRREHVVQDVLEYNDYRKTPEIRRNKIKQILKGYTKVGDSLKRELKDFGFVLSKEGGHYKLNYYGDQRYQFTMAATGGDSQHGGWNLASQIINKAL